MLSRKQLTLLTNRAIERFIYGLRATQEELRLPAKIPSPHELQVELSRKLNSMELGKPFFKGLHQPGITSAGRFNENLYDLVDDFTILVDELITQIYALTRHFSASEAEFTKITRRLLRMKFDVDALLLVCQNANGYMYSAGDNFSDRSMVDNSISTVMINTKGGFVELPDTFTSKVDMGHYSGAKLPDNFQVVGEYTATSFLGTTFSNCVDDIEDSYFMIGVTSPNSNGIGIKFSIKLDEHNDPIPINEVAVAGDPTCTVSLNYKNTYTSDWESLSDVAVIDNLAKFKVRPYALANNGKEIHPGITEVQFTFTRETPDRIVDGVYEYTFMIRNISSHISSNTGKAQLHSNSIPFEDWAGDPFTINQIALSVDEEVPAGAYIDYYIGIDPYASGTLLDSAGDPVGADSEDIDTFEFRSGYPGTSGVLYSTLRDKAISDWVAWMPTWEAITPIERLDSVANVSGVTPPRTLNLGTYQVVDQTTLGWSPIEIDSVNGIHYYNIYNFPSKPRDVELRQGRHAWIRTYENYSREISMEANGVFTADGTDYYLYIGPSYTPGDGYIVSPGKVVMGTVTNIVWYHSDIDDPDEQYLTTAVTPEWIPDINVSYDSDDGTATLMKNPSTVWSLPDYNVKLKYQYYEEAGKYRYETYVYVPPNAAPYISIGNVNKVDRIIIENVGSVQRIVYDASDLHTNASVPIPDGWNHLTIYINSGVSWDPISNVDIPDSLEYYAYMEPLTAVGRRALLYNTHRDDHSKVAIYPSGGWYYMAVNDPTTPTIASGISYYHDTLGSTPGRTDIFASGGTVNDFYDLAYKLVSTEVTNVILKAEFRSDGTLSPVLRSYQIRGGDTIKL